MKPDVSQAWLDRRLAIVNAQRGKKRQRERELRAFVHSQLAHEVGAQQMLMFYPIGSPVPPGWRLVEGQDMGHHHGYSQLLQRCER